MLLRLALLGCRLTPNVKLRPAGVAGKRGAGMPIAAERRSTRCDCWQGVGFNVSLDGTGVWSI